MSTKIASYLVALVAVSVIYVAAGLARKGRFSIGAFVVWSLLWAAIGFFSLFPSLLDHVMRLLTMGNRMFFMTTSGILVLLLLVFYLSSRVLALERRLTKTIQAMAVIEYDLRSRVEAMEDGNESIDDRTARGERIS